MPVDGRRSPVAPDDDRILVDRRPGTIDHRVHFDIDTFERVTEHIATETIALPFRIR